MIQDLAIIIPAHNEELTIGKVVKKSRIYGTPIVVNDGSTDRTSEIAKQNGAIIVSIKNNSGYDFALNEGLIFACKGGFKYALTIDADDQHPSELIADFKKKLIAGAEIVLGSRNQTQRISEKIFSFVSEYLWNIEDPLCGMKAYNISSLKKLNKLKTFDSIGTEIAIRMSKIGYQKATVKIYVNKRHGTSRFGSGFFSNIKILKALCINLVR
jgi:hypothetical protein